MKTTTIAARPGWNRVENREAGIAISVPDGWTAIDLSSGDVSQRIAEVSKTDSNIASVQDTVKKLAASGLYKMFVVRNASVNEGAGFDDNLNIVSQKAPANMGLDELVRNSMTGISQASGVPLAEIQNRKDTVAGRECRIVSVGWELNLATGKTPVKVHAYHFLAGGQLLAVTCTSTQERMPGLEDDFRQIVETLEIK